MRRIIRFLLLRPVIWAAAKFSSSPDRTRIFKALTKLSEDILADPGKKGLVLPFDLQTGRFIIFSDQHKGARNGADDFLLAEPNYLAALEHYNNDGFVFINLGDSEELWENTLSQVRKYNEKTFEAEKKFILRQAFIKIIGNHDLYWANDPFAWWQLKKIFGEEVKVYEGAVLDTMIGNKPLQIFCTHGHQGDKQSDGNWFSKFFVARIWAPLQSYLRINPNTPAYDAEKKTVHNGIMYEWSAMQKNMLLITGHTHQPVFSSLTHIERLYKRFQRATNEMDEAKLAELRAEIVKREKEFTAVSVDYMNMKPYYFNSGCCCFSDGDITGIEIDKGCIRLIKWTTINNISVRQLLEEISLEKLVSKD
jgi:UDP-2,3-diacylglucosamine pyrophosphatase LpxH